MPYAPRVPLNSRMTVNQARPSRYFAGKGQASETESSEEDSDDYDDQSQAATQTAPPKATSFPKKLTGDLKSIDLAERKRQQEREKRKQAWLAKRDAREEFEARDKMEKDAGFVTASESESESEREEEEVEPAGGVKTSVPVEKESEESSDEYDSDESSSEEEEAPKLLRPVFTKPGRRRESAPQEAFTASSNTDADLARRKEAADASIQAQINERAAMKTAANADWDADDNAVADEEAIDDTDGLDPELEHANWVARELGRLKRDREELERKEAELAEIERRRNLTTPEREEEDRQHVEKQKEERDNRGKMSYMQKYQHRGAFYQDEGEEAGLAKRDLMGAKYVDQVDKEGLPEYLKRRDETKVGKKGATRYKDMRSEDTGRFGDFLSEKKGRDRERTGANGEKLGEKRRGGGLEGAPPPKRPTRET